MTKRERAGRATGPRTAAGKATSSRNALKHGLSASRHLGVEEAKAVDEEATRIAAELPWPVERAVIAEWVICRNELANLRQVRADALRRAPEKVPRIERRARFSQLAHRLATLRGGPTLDPSRTMPIPAHDPRSWADIHADELADAIRAWHGIDRYETRIRSRMNRLQRAIYALECVTTAHKGKHDQ